ncbi:MAG: MBOAT family protein [Candidatus Sungbacteria bacterium]|nr:MBOAT family protein [Candidatus Sungbacteria bacterium]
MLFNSLQFLIFFAAVFLAYYAVVPDRYRWILLLAGSCYFYMAFVPAFILVLFFLITVDYFLGLSIARSRGVRRKMFLVGSVIANLGTLFFFKYFNFFNENIAVLARAIHWNYSPALLHILLPLGLSFHVFQSLSYVIEAYRGKQKPERHFGVYALYVMFFPQLVAGPIERPQHMLHQFHEPHVFDAVRVRQGLELMLWGFFKKLVIADRIALLVNHVYGNLGASSDLAIFLAAILFSYQIYCDFSGYSDIAVGSALVFGYDVTNNFNRPYASRSIAEFWRRWHISLSSWLRDYLYYPLAFAGKKVTKTRLYAGLFITFILIGLWHGANWTYVVFGSLHGGYLVLALWTADARKRTAAFIGFSAYPALLKTWQTLAVFALVCVSFVFFRAATVAQALYVLAKTKSAFLHLPTALTRWQSLFASGNFGFRSAGAIVIGICFLECVQYAQAKLNTVFIFEKKSRAVRWSWYYALIFGTLFLGYFGAQPFIYFKF